MMVTTGALMRRGPVKPQWVRDVIADCRRSGVAPFHKQWGSYRNNPLVVEQGMTTREAQQLDAGDRAAGWSMASLFVNSRMGIDSNCPQGCATCTPHGIGNINRSHLDRKSSTRVLSARDSQASCSSLARSCGSRGGVAWSLRILRKAQRPP
jgi:hypothetical protein